MGNLNDDYTVISYQANLGALGQNDLPVPTKEQLLSGKYAKGGFIYHGLKILIENPCHSYRKGIDQNGKAWACQMQAHYGYIANTLGKDGDELDVFFGVYPESDTVFIINQQDKDGNFDEHKIMLGFLNEANAKMTYQLSYDRGWNGLSSIIKANLSQFLWWLKYGNHKKPLQSNHLPLEGLESLKMAKFNWNNQDSDILGTTLAQVLYDLRQGGDGDLLNCPVTMHDIGEHIRIDLGGQLTAMDALLSKVRDIDRRMERLLSIMNLASTTDIKVIAKTISDPFKRNGTTNIAVLFELSDGQTVTVWFHNPDSTPNKLAPDDTLISWRWQINKKDVTLLVAPESGKDLDMRRIAKRIMAFIAKNSASFARANTKRTERLAAIGELEKTVTAKNSQLDAVNNELAATDALLNDAEVRLAELKAENAKKEDDFKSLRKQVLAFAVKNHGWTQYMMFVIGKKIDGVLYQADFGIKGDNAELSVITKDGKTNKETTLFQTVGVSELVNERKIEEAASYFNAQFEDYLSKTNSQKVQVEPAQTDKRQTEEGKKEVKDAVFAILANDYGWTVSGDNNIKKSFNGLAPKTQNSDGSRFLDAKFDFVLFDMPLGVIDKTDSAMPLIPETAVNIGDYGFDDEGYKMMAEAFNKKVNDYVSIRRQKVKNTEFSIANTNLSIDKINEALKPLFDFISNVFNANKNPSYELKRGNNLIDGEYLAFGYKTGDNHAYKIVASDYDQNAKTINLGIVKVPFLAANVRSNNSKIIRIDTLVLDDKNKDLKDLFLGQSGRLVEELTKIEVIKGLDQDQQRAKTAIYSIGKSKKNYVKVTKDNTGYSLSLVKDGGMYPTTGTLQGVQDWLARMMFVGGGTIQMVKKNIKLKEGEDLLELSSVPDKAIDADLEKAKQLAPDTKSKGTLNVGDSYVAKDADGVIAKYTINSINPDSVTVKTVAFYDKEAQAWVNDKVQPTRGLTSLDIAGIENKNGFKFEVYKEQSERDKDIDFLKDVINAQVNLTDASVGSRVDSLFDKYPDETDKEMQDLLDKAIDSITDATKQRASLANKG